MKPANLQPTYGVVLPVQFMNKWKNIYVKVHESGTSLILESGAIPMPFSKKQINIHSKKINVIDL